MRMKHDCILSWVDDSGQVRSGRFIALDNDDLILRAGDTLILLPLEDWRAGQRLAPEKSND